MITLFSRQSAAGTHADSLDRFLAQAPLRPFDGMQVEFVTNFCERLRASPKLRAHPELATVAHWFRPAALKAMAASLQESGEVIKARGVVFHLAPGNVDVLFAYAWLMSTLAGNVNIARLSQKPSAARDLLLDILEGMAGDERFAPALDRTWLLTYPHGDPATGEISARCHARIIWGGDNTVRSIRAIPLNPIAVELAFADRFGVAVFNAAAIARATSEELDDLAHRFCNDLLWFGQQACSSPRSVFWCGDNDVIEVARSEFWPRVSARARSFENSPAALMARVTDANILATTTTGLHWASAPGEFPARLVATRADHATREQQSGYGMVIEVLMESLDGLANQLDDRDQTLVAHGFNDDALEALIGRLQNRALDRIVAVGRALDFHRTWDGNDLFETLTRRVTLSRTRK